MMIAIGICIAILIGFYVWDQTEQESRIGIKNQEVLNHLRSRIHKLTEEKNRLNTDLYDAKQTVAGLAGLIEDMEKRLKEVEFQAGKPQKLNVYFPSGVELKTSEPLKHKTAIGITRYKIKEVGPKKRAVPKKKLPQIKKKKTSSKKDAVANNVKKIIGEMSH